MPDPNPRNPGEELLQVLTSSGERVPEPQLDPWLPELERLDGESLLTGLYEDMVVIRRIDAEATALQRQGELALWPPLLGQEAAQIGSGRAMRQDDFVFSSYREHGVAYCRGVDVESFLKAWRGNASFGWDPFEINMAPMQIIIGAQTLHAVGYAMGVQFDGADSAAVAYFGDGATSQGDVNEAMVFAASYQAPVIFFCQNNHWAISEPVELQTHITIAERAGGFGIPHLRVDGNDVLAVLAATRIALDRARQGGGPTFIEAVTYRMGPHTTADDPTRYRDPNELEDWAAKDPIVRLEKHLEARGLLSESVKARVKAKADEVAAIVRRGVVAIPEPEPLDVFRHAYATPNTWLERQEQHYKLYLEQFGQAGAEAGTPVSGGQH
ncbi:pyruvate dehydrogenase (acetyl-transferring) E1 component subunit alpha [Arthrobacter sp. NPDC090010]|uniref:pyruvate dehydrogenase (acetyl-transferring) E1 component subunit alpha n=1 Tax=Arthrobacter sp. NPDC090010 TaxID=3363942 RepID=UPI0037F5F659